MQTLSALLILATLLIASCNSGSAAKMPAGWPVAGMSLPDDAAVTEPIPALKMGQLFMSVADGDETTYSETVAFTSEAEFSSVVSGMEDSLRSAGYWSIPGKRGQALNISGYISESDDAFVTIMYTPLKEMFAVQAVRTASPSAKLKERREKEGKEL